MNSPFYNVAKQGTIGAVYGLVGGLVLSLVIYGILVLSALVFDPEGFIQGFPPQMVLLMGMGWGTVVGAIFGAITGLRK